MEFEDLVSSNIERLKADHTLAGLSREWMATTASHNYAYNFRWLGLPIIQYPQDIVVLQEIVWGIKPDLIIETGIARGGSLALSSSLLMMCDFEEAQREGRPFDATRPKRKVVGIDIDIRPHSRNALEVHPLRGYMNLIEGSSVDPVVIKAVKSIASHHQRVLVLLDSNHTHEHVLAELEAYAPLVSAGSYCIVYDTAIEDMPRGSFPNRLWDVGNNPKTAVHEYLNAHPEFVIDNAIPDKLQITVAPDGYLRRSALD
jgi:cephalosporin hydroxylase